MPRPRPRRKRPHARGARAAPGATVTWHSVSVAPVFIHCPVRFEAEETGRGTRAAKRRNLFGFLRDDLLHGPFVVIERGNGKVAEVHYDDSGTHAREVGRATGLDPADNHVLHIFGQVEENATSVVISRIVIPSLSSFSSPASREDLGRATSWIWRSADFPPRRTFNGTVFPIPASRTSW